MKPPLQAEGTDDFDESDADDAEVKAARVFLADMRAAYNKAAMAGVGADHLANIILAHAFATVQLTFDMNKADLAGLIGDSAIRYIQGGAFEANRRGGGLETMQ